MIRALRFLRELSLTLLVIFGGIGCVWIMSKLAPPVLEFLMEHGL